MILLFITFMVLSHAIASPLYFTPSELNSMLCPDGKSQCPDGSTCCKLTSGEWGCCPMLKAVCCSDGLHCCPNGTTCDVSRGKCNKGEFSMQWVKKTRSIPADSILCPDGKSQCPDGNTCCKLKTGEYGCCPLPKAVCCNDDLHCCPAGTTCDVSHGKCNSGRIGLPWLKKTNAMPAYASLTYITCPDQTECDDGQTCCELVTGKYGCCPLPKAVCCSDGLHCCPNGTTCDVSQGKCNKGDFSMPWVKKTLATPTNSILCPDGQSQCPDGSTCCKLSTGQWGCCPLPKAVCCSDGLHCCPSGTTCDVSQGKCNKGDFSMPWVKKTLALRNVDVISSVNDVISSVNDVISSVNDVTCKGGKQKCPDGNTCCEEASGLFGCCPFPDAVCCVDQQHCCPQGFTCDLQQTKCIKGSLGLPLMKKTMAQNVEVVVCPGGKQECPSQMTCCSVHGDLYGCCPVPDAVCCDDKIHCCPKDYTCKDSRCLNGDINLPMLERVSAKYTHKVESVMCPDGQSECPDGSTCCILASGQYGCCPLPKAVCCDDHQHCCPNGYKCDTAGGSCQKGDDAIPWLKKHNSIPMSGNVKCQDGSECPSGSTCCKLPTGDYGCCPYLDAVCCNDGLHCCPKGYTCNTKEGTCQKASINMLPWVKSSEGLVDLVTCPDKAKCPDKTTCCQLPSDKYACCPLEHAICCEDKIHCCPDYLTCDMPSGKCVRKSIISIPWMEKIPTLIDYVNVDVCPDGLTGCLSGQTCTATTSGQYNCCPMPNAVSCDGGEHCCPHGYACDKHQGCLEMDNVPLSSVQLP